jgi:hypothetical protein
MEDKILVVEYETTSGLSEIKLTGIKEEDIFVSERIIKFGSKAVVSLDSFVCYQYCEAK